VGYPSRQHGRDETTPFSRNQLQAAQRAITPAPANYAGVQVHYYPGDRAGRFVRRTHRMPDSLIEKKEITNLTKL